MQPSAPRDPESPAELSRDQLALVNAAIARLAPLRGALLPILHAVQHDLGFVPPAALPRIADALNLSLADVHGVVTFYHDFKSCPQGRTVLKLCRAEACQAMGSERLVQHLAQAHGLGMGQTSADGALTVDPVYCLGNCALSPSALVDGRLLGRVDERRLDDVVRQARAARAKGPA